MDKEFFGGYTESDGLTDSEWSALMENDPDVVKIDEGTCGCCDLPYVPNDAGDFCGCWTNPNL